MEPDKWAVAIQNLMKIIEKNEQKLAYFQNRLKQAQFIERPNMRMINAADGQADSYADQLAGLRSQLRELERLRSGGVRLRTTAERDLRRIWCWINGPALREILQTGPMTFHAYTKNWHHWITDGDMHPLSIELGTGELIGFILIKRIVGKSELRYASLKFIVIRPDYRSRGYGADAVKQAIAFAFERLEVEVFTLQVDLDNTPALRCFEKSGLGYIDMAPDNEDDVNADLYTIGIHREDWKPENAPAAELTQGEEDNTPFARASPYLSAKLLAPLKDLIENH